MTKKMYQIKNLEKYYFQNDSIADRLLSIETESIKAVDGVSFDIFEGETLGLVGESGCGKSTTGETIIGLKEATGGEILFDEEPLEKMIKTEEFRRRVQVVFQDPFSSLNPRMSAGQIVQEPLKIHGIGDKQERRDRADELLERVGLSADQRDRYPHEFSGGQRQRINIARALAIDPDFILLDEPVSALDVSVQAQILNLLADLQDDFNLTYLFIAHDLSVIKHISDRVAVMYLGEIVEVGPVDKIFNNPSHPYTEILLDSIPRADPSERHRDIKVPEGDIPSPRNPPLGCRFHTRCPHARSVCNQENPAMYSLDANHQSACFRVPEDHEYWESSSLNLTERSTTSADAD